MNDKEKLQLLTECLLDIAGNTSDEWAEEACKAVLKEIGEEC